MTDQSGRRQWRTDVEGDGNNHLAAMAIGERGAIYVAGETDKGLRGQNYNGGFTGFVAKLDRHGARQWAVLFDRPEDAYPGYEIHDLATGAQGGVYVAGKTDVSMWGKKHASEYSEGFVVKFDRNGRRKWVKLVGPSDSNNIFDLAADRRGGIYVVGIAQSQDNSGSVGFLARFDRAGNKQWWTEIVGGAKFKSANAVTVAQGGRIYVAGETSGPMGGEPYRGGESDGFVAVFNRSGVRKNVTLFGTSGEDRVKDVAVDGRGHVYAVGQTSKSMGGETYAGGEFDGFLRKIDF